MAELSTASSSATVSSHSSQDISLLGKWKLIRDGSDFLPGLDTLPDSPLVLKLLGNVDAEFYKIEKRKILDCEEIVVTYVTKNLSMTRSYQVGILNYEQVVNNDVTLAIVQNCDPDFHEFSLVRLGPKARQGSRETYKLDLRSDIIKLCVEMTVADGTRMTLVKYLARFDQGAVPVHYPENSSHHHHNHPAIVGNVPFVQSTNSMGWKLFEFWPTALLSSVQIKLVRAIKIKTQNSLSKEPVKVQDVLWEVSHGVLDVDYRNISRTIGGKSNEGEEVVEFVIQVTLGDSNWVVAHRYREFDALRKFLLSQNFFNAQFQQIDGKFPGKTVTMAVRKNVLERRAEGLEHFLAFYLENARYCGQSSVDALCSFLQLPEHMHAVASKVAAEEAAQAAANSVAHARAMALSSNSKTSPSSSAAALAALNSDPSPLQSQKSKRLSIFGGRSTQEEKKSSATESAVSAVVLSAPVTAESAASVGAAAKPAATAPPVGLPPRAASSGNATNAADAAQPAVTPKSSVSSASTSARPLPSAPAATSAAKDAPAPSSSATSVTTSVTINANPALVSQLSPAQLRLLQFIGGSGIAVIKHGRQGAPKHRVLTCDDEVTTLIVQASDSHFKKCLLSEVEGIRLGTDVDPATPKEVLERAMNGGASTSERTISRRISLRKGGGADDGMLFGTAILRRTCKKEDMSMCVSLILPNRTFDIQCMKIEDLQTLYSCLTDICGK